MLDHHFFFFFMNLSQVTYNYKLIKYENDIRLQEIRRLHPSVKTGVTDSASWNR